MGNVREDSAGDIRAEPKKKPISKKELARRFEANIAQTVTHNILSSGFRQPEEDVEVPNSTDIFKGTILEKESVVEDVETPVRGDSPDGNDSPHMPVILPNDVDNTKTMETNVPKVYGLSSPEAENEPRELQDTGIIVTPHSPEETSEYDSTATIVSDTPKVPGLSSPDVTKVHIPKSHEIVDEDVPGDEREDAADSVSCNEKIFRLFHLIQENTEHGGGAQMTIAILIWEMLGHKDGVFSMSQFARKMRRDYNGVRRQFQLLEKLNIISTIKYPKKRYIVFNPEYFTPDETPDSPENLVRSSSFFGSSKRTTSTTETGEGKGGRFFIPKEIAEKRERDRIDEMKRNLFFALCRSGQIPEDFQESTLKKWHDYVDIHGEQKGFGLILESLPKSKKDANSYLAKIVRPNEIGEYVLPSLNAISEVQNLQSDIKAVTQNPGIDITMRDWLIHASQLKVITCNEETPVNDFSSCLSFYESLKKRIDEFVANVRF